MFLILENEFETKLFFNNNNLMFSLYKHKFDKNLINNNKISFGVSLLIIKKLYKSIFS